HRPDVPAGRATWRVRRDPLLRPRRPHVSGDARRTRGLAAPPGERRRGAGQPGVGPGARRRHRRSPPLPCRRARPVDRDNRPFFPKRAPGEPDRRTGSGEAIRVAPQTADHDAAPGWVRPEDDAVRASAPDPVADFIVQALPEDGAGDADASQPIRLGPPELDRGPHLSYAIQWFSFATIALIGWAIVVARRWTTGERREAVEGPGA